MRREKRLNNWNSTRARAHTHYTLHYMHMNTQNDATAPRRSEDSFRQHTYQPVRSVCRPRSRTTQLHYAFPAQPTTDNNAQLARVQARRVAKVFREAVVAIPLRNFRNKRKHFYCQPVETPTTHTNVVSANANGWVFFSLLCSTRVYMPTNAVWFGCWVILFRTLVSLVRVCRPRWLTCVVEWATFYSSNNDDIWAEITHQCSSGAGFFLLLRIRDFARWRRELVLIIGNAKIRQTHEWTNKRFRLYDTRR